MGPRGSAIVCAAIAVLCVIVLLEEPTPPTETELAVRRGEEVFRNKAMCLVCHSLHGRGGQNGPPLEHIEGTVSRVKGSRDQARQFFLDRMIDPANHPGPRHRAGSFPNSPCPSYRGALEERELQDIAEYLLTLE